MVSAGWALLLAIPVLGDRWSGSAIGCDLSSTGEADLLEEVELDEPLRLELEDPEEEELDEEDELEELLDRDLELDELDLALDLLGCC